MKDYTLDDIKNIVRPRLGEDIPLVLYRSLRIIGMRHILGEASGATLYMIGKQIGGMFEARDTEEFAKGSWT